MTEIWNLWDVKPPPVCTVKSKLYYKEMNDLSQIAYDALKTFKNLSYFEREAGLLSRFLYRHRRIFRHDKGTQDLVKMNQCLKRYLKLNMCEVFLTFKQSIPFKISPISTHIYFPTRQMLKWVLLRLQAFSQIFVRMIDLAKAAGSYIYKKICLGWSLYNSFLVFCIIARILVTSKYLVAKSIEWYSSLYKYLPYLEETSDYLSGYNFPLNLKQWLGKVDLTPIKKKFVDNIFEFIDLISDDEEEDKRPEKLLNEEFIRALFKTKKGEVDLDAEEVIVEEPEKDIKQKKQPLQPSLLSEDLGVPVEDDEEEVPKKRKGIKERSGKKIFIDLVSEGSGKRSQGEKEQKRKEIFIDLVSAEDKEETSKGKRKRTFIDLVPVEERKEEVSKKKRKKKLKGGVND